MSKSDWYEAGEQIKNLVQDAIDHKDFSQLSNTITNVVNRTMDELQQSLKDSFEAMGKKEPGERQEPEKESFDHRAAAERIRRNMWEKQQAKKKEPETKPVKYRRPPGIVSGNVMAWTGYGMTFMFGLTLIITGMADYTMGISGMEMAYGTLGLFFALSLCVGTGGSRRLGLAKRFRRYMQIIKDRSFCTVEELASGTGRSIKQVRRDLRRMVQKGFFPEGHLDRKQTCLMLTNETYQQYLTAQQEYDRRSLYGEEAGAEGRNSGMEAAGRKEDGNEPASHETDECRELIQEGEKYILHIHQCNDRIEDPEMSGKLDRLELLITRIFREARKNPDTAADLKKMMSYYLPTTKKLLDAYCELDAQPVKGQNIEGTKKEIEDTLDTLNTAFGNLLDSLFQETAWDISSDISVLETMLAQEGLTGHRFGSGKEK